jgi:hypothetical protein
MRPASPALAMQRDHGMAMRSRDRTVMSRA